MIVERFLFDRENCIQDSSRRPVWSMEEWGRSYGDRHMIADRLFHLGIKFLLENQDFFANLTSELIIHKGITIDISSQEQAKEVIQEVHNNFWDGNYSIITTNYVSVEGLPFDKDEFLRGGLMDFRSRTSGVVVKGSIIGAVMNLESGLVTNILQCIDKAENGEVELSASDLVMVSRQLCNAFVDCWAADQRIKEEGSFDKSQLINQETLINSIDWVFFGVNGRRIEIDH